MGLRNVFKVRIGVKFYCSKAVSRFVFSPTFPDELKDEFRSSFIVHENFASPEEEDRLMAEFEPHLKRHIYEKDHWDNVSLSRAVSFFFHTFQKEKRMK